MNNNINLSRFESDLNDAFKLLFWTIEPELDFNPKNPDHLKIKNLWDKSLEKGEMESYCVHDAFLRFRHWDHGRDIHPSRLNCPIIVGKSSSGNYIVLDGSHRLIKAKKIEKETIPCFIIDVSFCQEIEDMS